MPRFKNKQDLSKIQIRERAKRRRNSARGLMQAKGTPPLEHRLPEEPVFRPVKLAQPIDAWFRRVFHNPKSDDSNET